jgi:hypothetical protein
MKNKPIKTSILKEFGREPATMDELAQLVIDIVNHKIKKHNSRVVGFAWTLQRSKSVSNSHHSPEGYPQNWGGKKGLPSGYPGWQGRVWIRYSPGVLSFGSDHLRYTLTHTGTGGAGAYCGPWDVINSARFRHLGHRSLNQDIYPEIDCYSWDYKIFDADWPLITDAYEKDKVWSVLSEQRPNLSSTHHFQWTDPEVEQADLRFITKYAKLEHNKAMKETA